MLLASPPCEPTVHERALFVAPAAGGLQGALSLPYSEFLLLEAHREHQLTMEALTEAASGELSMPPPSGNDAEAARQREDWLARCEDAQLRVIEEDHCFHDELDSEYGERLDPPPLYHWLDLAEEVEPRSGSASYDEEGL